MSEEAPRPAAAPETPPVGTRDIAHCFRLFLGREPDEAILAEGWATTLPDLLRAILETDEFKAAVLTPLLLREPLPHGRLGSAPLLLWIDWAQERLPLAGETRRAIGAARSWELLLELLLSDPGLTGLAPEITEAGVDLILRERLATEATAIATRSVIGEVEAASAFEVRGWALDMCDKATPVILELYADAAFLGAIRCDEPRPDVKDIVGGDGNCGFTFRISEAHRARFAPGRALSAVDAISKVQVGTSSPVHADAVQAWDTIDATRRELVELRRTLERVEARLPELNRLASVPLEAYGEYWERFYRPTPDVLAAGRARGAQFPYRPLVSIILPTWNSDTRLLHRAIGSALAQVYDAWELIIADDASTRGDELRRLLHRHAAADPRIRLVEGTTREGIAGNTNRGLAEARGDYVAFLDHDDALAPDALLQVVAALQERRYALVYSDEDRVEEDESGRLVHHTPFFKPDFDPDLLLSMNYICHLVVIRRDILDGVGGLRPGFDGAQDHDLLLRATAGLPAEDIRHVSRILYHWRFSPGSVSESPGLVETIRHAIVTAVDEHLQRQGVAAGVEPHADPLGGYRQFATRVRWPLQDPAPGVSIILPTRDRLDLLQPCLESLLRSAAAYPGPLEILLVDNDSVEPATRRYLDGLAAVPAIRLIRFRGAFNWSAINNMAAAEAVGEVLVFLNNDTVVPGADWCAELVAHAMRPEVGAVGARLLYGDGTLQHAGVVLGVEGVAGHDSIGEAPSVGGYFGRSHVLRGAAAVTGACMATRRALFRQLAGFDEIDLKIAFSDVDYCLKLRAAGYRVIYNPFAALYHFESKSRGREVSEAQRARYRAEVAAFRARWGRTIEHDPFYNPHFERYARAFDRLRPPPPDG